MTDIRCPYMWTQVQVQTDGGSAPCCMAMGNDDLEWEKQPYEDGVMGAKWVEGRAQMERGEWPKICTVCKTNEERGILSSREIAVGRTRDMDISVPKTLILDMKYTTKCNLACRMCHPSDSSLVAEHYNKETPEEETPHFLRNRMLIPVDTSEEKVAFTKKVIIDGLQHLKCTGGEPTASIAFMKMIDWCIEEGYSNMLTIEITTNGTTISKSLLRKLEQFRSVTFNISLDGFEHSYDYIRWPSKLDKVKSNLRLLKDFWVMKPRDSVTITTIAQIYNLFELDKIEAFAVKELGFRWWVSCDIRPVDSELGLWHLPRSVTEQAMKKYWYKDYQEVPQGKLYSDFGKYLDKDEYDKTYLEKLSYHKGDVELISKHVNVDLNKEAIYKNLQHAQYSVEKHKQFVYSTLLMDRQRNQSYKTLHPCIVEYIDAKL